MTEYDFANILLSGPCNLHCPHCIGLRFGSGALPNNLDEFPLRNLDYFVTLLRKFGIQQVSLTGINTEPQLYRHERALITRLRRSVPGVKLSLHTNGTMAFRKSATLSMYDRVTISIPSFRTDTYRAMTGSSRVPDLAAILKKLTVPDCKISVLVTDDNRHELRETMGRCAGLGIRRLVFRKLYGDRQEFDLFPEEKPDRYFGGNPVYLIDGMEVTIWDFERSQLHCLNLFSDGRVSSEYRLLQEDRGGQHVNV